MKKFDEFIDETAFFWFLVLVITVGFIKWLIIWALYEIFISIFFNTDEKKLKKEKKRQKKELKETEKMVKEVIRKSEKLNKRKYI